MIYSSSDVTLAPLGVVNSVPGHLNPLLVRVYQSLTVSILEVFDFFVLAHMYSSCPGSFDPFLQSTPPN